jgi:oligoribonuclease NrnB/cAMP/cGMP phosphodiesterase (DHH superfamily)
MLNEEQVRQIIKEEMAKIFHSEKYHFSRDIQIANGRNIETGVSVGTMIGTSTSQKVGLYGKAPVARQAAIVYPNVQGGTYNQTNAETLRSAINDILNRLETIGMIAP